MNNKIKIIVGAALVLVIGLFLLDLAGVVSVFPVRSEIQGTSEPDQAGMANPASVHCEEQGYTLEMRTDENGGQYGVCIFPDGSECDEWAYFRGECSPATGE